MVRVNHTLSKVRLAVNQTKGWLNILQSLVYKHKPDCSGFLLVNPWSQSLVYSKSSL
jgi:hypothetical protein